MLKCCLNGLYDLSCLHFWLTHLASLNSHISWDHRFGTFKVFSRNISDNNLLKLGFVLNNYYDKSVGPIKTPPRS